MAELSFFFFYYFQLTEYKKTEKQKIKNGNKCRQALDTKYLQKKSKRTPTGDSWQFRKKIYTK